MSAYPINLKQIKIRVEQKKLYSVRRRKKLASNFLRFDDFFPNVKEQYNDFNEKIIRVDGEIPPNLPVSNGDRFLFISYDQTYLTHGLHKYPAKFFPELPRWFIKRYSSTKDTILDPFSGSATTNLEALLNERHSIGIDVDPFSRFISKVKTTPLNPQALEESSEIIFGKIVEFRPNKVSKEDIPNFPYRDNWFNQEILLELAFIKKIINKSNYSEDIKDFYRVCFSSIIRAVSNADNNCTRTVVRKKLNKKVYPADALTKFVETLFLNLPKIKHFSDKCNKTIKTEFSKNSDARKIKFDDNYFDLAVTSPPYVNAVDYPRTHQLEIYWLGLCEGSLTPLKKMHVGTESVSVKDYKQFHKIGIKEADVTLKRIFKKDNRRSYIAFKYLHDMETNLKEVYRVLKKNGRYVVVVGNNKIRGELFENWKYIMELAERVGFKTESFFASEIIKHFIKVPREERINTDWVLVLRK